MLSGDVRRFAVINTVDYNGDGQWAVQVVAFHELDALGFDEQDMVRIGSLGVGDIVNDFADYEGCLVVRVA